MLVNGNMLVENQYRKIQNWKSFIQVLINELEGPQDQIQKARGPLKILSKSGPPQIGFIEF